MRGDVKLRYCKVGDEIHPVSYFAHLAPKERPFSICPESEYIELFAIRRDNPEPPYKPEELYLISCRYGGKLLVSEEPITENSAEEIKRFYRDWLLFKSRGAQKVIHITNWIEESEFSKFRANYVKPFIWHPVLLKWIPRE